MSFLWLVFIADCWISETQTWYPNLADREVTSRCIKERSQVQDKNDYATHDLGMLLTCRFSWWLNRPALSQDLPDSCEQQMAVTPKINQKVHVAAVLPCSERNCDRRVCTTCANKPDKTTKGWWVGVLKLTYGQLYGNTSLPLSTKRPNSPWSITRFCHVTARKLSVQKVLLNFYATGSEIQAQLPKTTLTLIQCVTLITSNNI